MVFFARCLPCPCSRQGAVWRMLRAVLAVRSPAREVERVPRPYCPGDGIWGLVRCPQQAAGCLGVPGWAEGCRGPAGQEGRVERWEPSAQQPLG